MVERIPKNFGLRKADIRKLGYSELEAIFYGLHNLDIPVGVLAVENPDEMLANYLAAGELKRYNRHLSSDLPRDFLALVKRMNRVAYNSASFRQMANGCSRRFSAKPGEQQRRLAGLGRGVQDAFVDSFFSHYRPSNREEKTNPDAFGDPNIDGHSSTIYVNSIFDSVERKYREVARAGEN